MSPQKIAVAAAAVGLLATGGAATALAAPAGTAAAPVLTAFSVPLGNGHGRGWDNDHGRGWDGRRDRDGGWDGRPWRFWHDGGISADLCRDGGGHVNWDRHRCDGGRFDDFHIR
jgi:hypothetical protein